MHVGGGMGDLARGGGLECAAILRFAGDIEAAFVEQSVRTLILVTVQVAQTILLDKSRRIV